MTQTTRCLSVVMPCFNETATVLQIIERVLASPYVAEIVVVDDGSTDGTPELVDTVADPRVRLVRQPENLGKGAALRRGFQEITSDLVVVQDADLEYDPTDYAQLLGPLLDGLADVVYGSRFHSGRAHRVLYYWHSVGNRMLTTASNMFSGLNLTDMETCYKAFRREVVESLDLQEDRFGIEPEITAKVARANWRVYEVGISYAGRTYAEGKKIGWRDGVRALYSIVRYSPLLERAHGFPIVRTEAPIDFADSDSELASTLDSLRSARNYHDWIFEMCEPHLGDHVLEVGAGHGDFTGRLADDGRRVTAIDPSERCVERLEKEFANTLDVEVVHADISGLPREPTYSSAVLINVLEHIDDDLAALTDLRERLRPGGRVIVFAPAFESLYSDYDRLIGHRRRYRRSHLVMLADRAGLEVVDARYVNSVGAVVWWLVARRLHQIPTSPGPVRLYDNLAVPALRQVETRRTPNFGQSVMLIASVPGPHEA
jgi:glycosyltransferase involved in cell wall biosynthesis/precorrin-6B methylase 2